MLGNTLSAWDDLFMNWLSDLLDSDFAKAIALSSAVITIVSALYAKMRCFGWRVRFERLETQHRKSERLKT